MSARDFNPNAKTVEEARQALQKLAAMLASSGGDVVLKSLYDANTILTANSDDTPIALTVAEQTLVGRITGGVITALSIAQIRTLVGLAVGTNGKMAKFDAAGMPADATNTDTDVADAVTKKHTQGTDAGTTGASFTVDSDATTGKLKLTAVAGAADKTLEVKTSALTDDVTITLPATTGTVALAGAAPTAHKDSHITGGADIIPSATTSAVGLAPAATAPGADLLNVLAITNGETVRTDKALFDTTNPAALGVASPGSGLVAARRNHVHPMPSAGDVGAVATGAAVLKADFDAKGDLMVATAASTPARLAVGATDGMALVVDAASGAGVKWALVEGGDFEAFFLMGA